MRLRRRAVGSGGGDESLSRGEAGYIDLGVIDFKSPSSVSPEAEGGVRWDGERVVVMCVYYGNILLLLMGILF